MSKDITIFSVDDSAINQELIKGILGNKYSVITAMSGEAFLEMLEGSNPSLILMDITMDGISGYEACIELRKNPKYDNIPVLFVSAATSAEDRLEAYKSGGQDYICKPIEPEELFYKIDVLLQNKKAQEASESQLKSAQTVAMSAMTNTAEMGEVLQLVRASFQVNSVTALSEALIGTLRSFSLNASFQFRMHNTKTNFSTDGSYCPLEKKLLDDASTSDKKIVRFSNKALFNGKKVTIFIKNNPIEDQDREGRLVDHMAIVLDTIDAKLDVLAIELEMKLKRQAALKSMAEQTNHSLHNIENQFKQFNSGLNRILEGMLMEMEQHLLTLGLTEAQEESVLNLLEKHKDHIDQLYDECANIDDSIHTLHQEITKVAELG